MEHLQVRRIWNPDLSEAEERVTFLVGLTIG
jgi:hypothetical protein